MNPRDDVCALARMSVGDGPLSSEELADVGGFQGQQWCGLWLLERYRQAGITTAKWSIGRSLPWAMPRCFQTMDPKPGDFGIVRKHQHHMLVEEVFGQNSELVHVIAGNTGLPPGKVDRNVVRKFELGITWYSISAYIKESV